MLSPTQALALMADPSLLLTAQGFDPDPWQRDLLFAPDRQILLLCSRGAGKSRSVSALALHTALFQAGALVLLVSPSQRQSVELFRYVKQGFQALARPLDTLKENETTLEFGNGSRVVCLPGREGTIRSYQGVRLLVLDEAARVPDDLYRTVRPMLAVSHGRLVAMTTPFGQRGWFWDEWERNESFKKVRVPWQRCPRITPAFIESEHASFGDRWVQQEYECSFGALEGLVYPTFADALYLCYPVAKAGKPVGGADAGEDCSPPDPVAGPPPVVLLPRGW